METGVKLQCGAHKNSTRLSLSPPLQASSLMLLLSAAPAACRIMSPPGEDARVSHMPLSSGSYCLFTSHACWRLKSLSSPTTLLKFSTFVPPPTGNSQTHKKFSFFSLSAAPFPISTSQFIPPLSLATFQGFEPKSVHTTVFAHAHRHTNAHTHTCARGKRKQEEFTKITIIMLILANGLWGIIEDLAGGQAAF